MLLVYLLLTTSVAEGLFRGYFYRGDQVIRVVPKTKRQVSDTLWLRNVPGLEKLDSWMPTFRSNHPADFYARKKELPLLKRYLASHNISFSILVRNVTEAVLKQRTLKRVERYKNGTYDYEHFHPLKEIHDELAYLAKKYPDKTRIIELGKSYQNRSMKAIKIFGRNTKQKINKKNKKKIGNRKMFVIDCGTHAREWISPATCMWLIKEILSEKEGMKKMCNRIDWVIIPVLNVDGYEYSWSEEGRFWRKNRRPNNGSDCIGTDLNRNWAYKWGGNGSSDNPCASSYRGEAPFSEIETRNVAKFMYRRRCQLLGYIGFHSYSQLWMTPWGYKTDRPEHYSEMKRVANVAVNAIRNSGEGVEYEEPGPSSEIIYRNTGSPKDWTYGVLNIQYSYGVELRPHFNGNHGFLIPPDQIKSSGREIVAAMKAMSRVINLNEGRKVLNQAHGTHHDGHEEHAHPKVHLGRDQT